MRSKSLAREMLCGLVVGLLIMPAQPAQAQWTVFDPSAYTQRVKSEIKRVQEWVQRVQQYQMMYTNAVQQLTTLGGVLKTVDKLDFGHLGRITNSVSQALQ
jgi:type IV secretion system protein TrbJ